MWYSYLVLCAQPTVLCCCFQIQYQGCQTGAALLDAELLQWKQPATQLLTLQAIPKCPKTEKHFGLLGLICLTV